MPGKAPGNRTAQGCVPAHRNRGRKCRCPGLTGARHQRIRQTILSSAWIYTVPGKSAHFDVAIVRGKCPVTMLKGWNVQLLQIWQRLKSRHPDWEFAFRRWMRTSTFRPCWRASWDRADGWLRRMEGLGAEHPVTRRLQRPRPKASWVVGQERRKFHSPHKVCRIHRAASPT